MCRTHSSNHSSVFLFVFFGLCLIGLLPHQVFASTSPSVPATNGLQLASVSAAVLDTRTGDLVYDKNADTVMPIASLSKLMSAMVLLDGRQPLDEVLTIKRLHSNDGKNSYSRLRPGSRMKRQDLLLLSLMSSENLATYNLAEYYPGGRPAFIQAMNAKARQLEMKQTRFNDAAGLSVANVSTARDVVRMVIAASGYPLIREYSTSRQHTASFRKPSYRLGYSNTNRLVSSSQWDIALSKTGYLNEAGRCLALLARIDGRNLVIVLLDSFGKQSHIGDAGRVRRWIETGTSGKVATAALRYQAQKARQLGIVPVAKAAPRKP